MYALGQFINGALGDRVGARRMLAFGMMGTSLVGFVMGIGQTGLVFAIAWGVNGLFQSTGWPNNVRAMAPWFSRDARGAVMGIWCTNYQVGGLVATALATFLVAHVGWRWAFFAPSMWVAAFGGILLVFLVERPKDAGLAPLDPDRAAAPPRAAPFREMMRIKRLWALGAAYFGLKLIRYTLLFWLPYYLEKSLGYDQETAGYASTSFEVGGVLGVVLVGWMSNRWSTNRSKLIAPILFALAAALFLYQWVGAAGLVPNVLVMALVGFMLFGPDALISGAAAQDIGGPDAAASAAGIINGLGSIGGILSGVVPAFVAASMGWDAVFYLFVVVALISAGIMAYLALAPPPAHARRR